MFADVAVINVKAGDGGAGSVSFRREKYIASGGPDGGDGGNGGNVVFLVDTNISSLINFKYRTKYEADNGMPGSAKKCSGKNGEDLVIKVPLGTLVTELQTGRVVADMSDYEPKIVARGGKGGWGNVHFATPTRQAPRFAKQGLPGENLELKLELKLLADVGLVGFPNVGKSTLISVCSEARPKIANYHFTTLTPTLGVVKIGEESSFVMADIPGLIEGASDGAGLGHEFLRHVERCRLIVHVVDVSGSEGRNPKDDFEKINAELERFNPELAKRPQIVAANKSDIADEKQIEEFKKYIKEKGYEVFDISAASSVGVTKLINKVAEELSKLPPVKRYEAEPRVEEIDVKAKNFEINIAEDGAYEIDAPWLERILAGVNMEDYESLQYFQRTLRNCGIIDKLEEMGIKEGDTVRIFDFEFDFVF